jgi:hypothetical protein
MKTPKSMLECEGSSGNEGQKKSLSLEKVMTKGSPSLQMSPARRKKLYSSDTLDKPFGSKGHQLSGESPQPFLFREEYADVDRENTPKPIMRRYKHALPLRPKEKT